MGFGNRTKRQLKFLNMHFRNTQKSFYVPIPNTPFAHDGVITLLVTRHPEKDQRDDDDLFVSPDKIRPDPEAPDALLLCDAFGNELELYSLDDFQLDAARCSPAESKVLWASYSE